MVAFKDDNLGASPVALARMQEAIGWELPMDYRTFVLQRNGGRVVPNIFPMGRTIGSVRKFLGVEEARNAREMLILEAELSPELWPVAACEGGDLALLRRMDGAVCYWQHDSGDLIAIAPSFAAFMASISTPPPTEDGPKDPTAHGWINPALLKKRR
jgi:hypothetical protein